VPRCQGLTPHCKGRRSLAHPAGSRVGHALVQHVDGLGVPPLLACSPGVAVCVVCSRPRTGGHTLCSQHPKSGFAPAHGTCSSALTVSSWCLLQQLVQHTPAAGTVGY
jgi:hypothetical protein